MFKKKAKKPLTIPSNQMVFNTDIVFLDYIFDKVCSENLEVKLIITLGREKAKVLTDEQIKKIAVEMAETVENYLSDQYVNTLLKYFNGKDLLTKHIVSKFYFKLVTISKKVNSSIVK